MTAATLKEPKGGGKVTRGKRLGRALTRPWAALVMFTALLAVAAAACGGGSSSGGGGGAATTSEGGGAASSGAVETSTSGGGKPIIVGAAIAQTGPEAPFDVPPTQAFQQAAEEVNAAGGILGRQVQVIVRDMKSDPSLGGRVAQDLIDAGAEMLLVPCDPDLGAPGAIVGQQKGILVFSLCEASARFGPQGIGPLVFTPSHITYLEGYVMAEWANMEKGYTHAFMIADKTFSGYNLEVCKGFEKRWKELAGDAGLVGTDTVSSSDTSIAATITRIKNASPAPDFIFMCSEPPSSPGWLRQIRAAGLDIPVLLDMAQDGNYWLKAVPNINDIYYPSAASIYGDDPSPDVNDFVKTFTEKQGNPPDTAYSLFGAAVMDLWKQAVEKAGTTEGAAVQKVLETFNKVPTIVGDTTYTGTSHIALDRPMEIMQVQNGKISYLETWQVKQAPTLTG
jgi:branched-chain amino acid transport system substrate-binding protein